jgi:hypothetical protein
VLVAQREGYDLLPNAERQEFDEIYIVRKFVKAAGLTVEPGSMRNEKPRKPDISCQIDGERRLFELGTVVNEKVAAVHDAALSAGGASAATAYSPIAPVIRMLKKKADSAYETGCSEVELVLYFYEQSPDYMPLYKCLNAQAPEIDTIIQKSQFSDVWIYDLWSDSISWRWERQMPLY